MVQTGPKTQEGGLNGGLWRPAYQVERVSDVVKAAPRRAAPKVRAKRIISLTTVVIGISCNKVISLRASIYAR